MADDTLNNSSGAQESNPAEDRIKQLSNKVETTAKERDDEKALRAQDQQRIAELERENSFSTNYADMLSTYPSAKDHKDDIKGKVMSGYTVEDATLAVLGKAGKLGSAPPPPRVAGGSADTAMSGGASKEMKDMTQAEKRAVLEQNIVWS